MNALQLGLVLVASIWAAMNTLIAGYNAVNGTRDRILPGKTDEGVPLSLPHRRIMYQNDWVPLKFGLAFVSLAFGGFLISLRVALIFALSLPAAASSPYDMNEIAENPEMALPAYLYEQFSSYSTHSSGSLGIEGIGRSVSFMTGARRQEHGFNIRAQCGVIIEGEPDDALHELLLAGCEKRLLRTIKKLSQSAEPGPYRAGGASEIEWQSRVITLVTSDIAYVVEGRYTNNQMATPCLHIDNCCSTNGALYIDSCREPTDTEWGAIDHCQSKGLGCRSPEYLECLREQGVKAGCETQPDGSRICY